MPVIIDDNNAAQTVDLKGNKTTVTQSNASNYSPKFFHKNILTGKGGQSRGLLNEKWDPKMNASGYQLQPPIDMEFETVHNGDIKIYNIPCYLISNELWESVIKTFERPSLTEMTKIAQKGTEEVYITAPLHGIQIQELQIVNAPGATATHSEKSLAPLINMFVFFVNDMSVAEHNNAGGLQMIDLHNQQKKNNVFYQDITNNLVRTLLDLYHKLDSLGYTIDKQVMDDFLQNYSLYAELCKATEKWLTKTDYFINDVLIKNAKPLLQGQTDIKFSRVWSAPHHSVIAMLSRLEKYQVPLDQYKILYDNMIKMLPAQVTADICKANLNLKLSNTLQHMNQNRQQNTFVACTKHAKFSTPLSFEQIQAVESESPFVLVQSGAGTGKSTVIKARIKHMVENGVAPNDIMVLSFTNAAANHIKDLRPDVHSMTIAAMLHTIYSHNYPSHQLSSISTILNSLDIYYGKRTGHHSDFIYEFKRILERLRDNNEYTKANNFVEDNIDAVIDVLNTIKQTSLELESIICYQKIDTLIEPDETKAKHLIIDEVQDNSIAEFIYSICYTDKHQCSMYIVGDSSQTLYEFRASNPKALNVLESSGVFDTYKLQTNYRSNQEILDFANVLLGNIEANQYANIQLKANSLAPVTKKSFEEAVTLHYERMLNKSAATVDAMVMHAVSIDMKNWIDDKLQKGEQVAFLAPKRFMLNKLEQYLRKTYGFGINTGEIVSIVSVRTYDNATFSKFIARYWDDIKYAPPMNILTTIRRELMQRFDSLMYRGSQAMIQKAKDDMFGRPGDFSNSTFGQFEKMYGQRIMTWQNQVATSVITTSQMLDNIKTLMIDFEIKKNAVAQAVLSNRNAERKNQDQVKNAKFILSTIHGAKGLEFDNVVIMYESESAAATDEATKRMYYVAFTRARKAEYIFAYDTLVHPKICGDYAKIIDDLDKQAQVANSSQTDDMTSDDIIDSNSNNENDD